MHPTRHAITQALDQIWLRLDEAVGQQHEMTAAEVEQVYGHTEAVLRRLGALLDQCLADKR